jgi:hypothetical protein
LNYADNTFEERQMSETKPRGISAESYVMLNSERVAFLAGNGHRANGAGAVWIKERWSIRGGRIIYEPARCEDMAYLSRHLVETEGHGQRTYEGKTVVEWLDAYDWKREVVALLERTDGVIEPCVVETIPTPGEALVE